MGLLSLLILSGVTLAQQSGEQKKDSPTQGMMQEMMKAEQSGEGKMEGMGGMGGMMRMTKMMDQCAAMMEKCCPATDSGEKKENPKQ